MKSPALNLHPKKSYRENEALGFSAEEFKSLLRQPPLDHRFYLKDTIRVAHELVGKILIKVSEKGIPIISEIVEVEAYLGTSDPASHAFRGLTKRNWPMFEAGGICYVYLSYGLNFCMNVSTGEPGVGEAVLLRAARPLYGMSVIREKRPKILLDRGLMNGPGKLTASLGIDLSHNGLPFDKPALKIVDGQRRYPKSEIGTSPRIGISKAVNHPWRFFVKGSPWLSRA